MSPKPKIVTRNREQPPLTYGPQRLHYQYSAVLPTLHLTLVSILQGIAFGVLLQGIPLISLSNAHPLDFLLGIYFYFPYLISSLLILLIWKEFVQAAVFSLWPLSTLQAGLTYLIAVVEILTFRLISLPSGQTNVSISSEMLSEWIIGFGFVGIVGGLIRLNNLLLQKLEDYESREVGEISMRGEKREGLIYICLGLILIIFGLQFEHFILLLSPGIRWIIPWSILTLILIFVVLVILLDRSFRIEFLRGYVKGSDLKVSSQGVIRYDHEIDEEKDPTQELVNQIEILQTQVQNLTQKIDAMQEQEQIFFQKIYSSSPQTTRTEKAVNFSILSPIKKLMKREFHADQ